MTAPDAKRDFDLVLWGATGFTGRLVAEYLMARYGTGGELTWAIAGRSHDKLAGIRAGLGADAEDLPILTGDSEDPRSLAAIAAASRVICSTVGPFARYGSNLVAACVAAGTHYCDITGEVQWIRRMIDGHEARARATGARIVHCCGFDSIPSDMGCHFLQQAAIERLGGPCEEVRLRVRRMRGAFSGGTVASLLNVVDEARRDAKVRRILGDPYGLNPEDARSGPDGPDQKGPVWDEDSGAWTAPFVMAAINTRVVRRTNAVRGFPYGRDFRYSEAVLTGSGIPGWTRAMAMSAGLGGFLAATSIAPAKALLEKLLLPKPGEGPDADAREKGFFDISLTGRRGGEVAIRGRVKGKRDPGYGATSRMLGESAVCLASDGDRIPVEGGFWTPASALGDTLLERLEKHADLSFQIIE